MKEEIKDTISYIYEDCDNGCVLEEKEYSGQKEVALLSEGENKYNNIKSLLGRWLWEDLYLYMNQQLTSNVKINIKFEKIDD